MTNPEIIPEPEPEPLEQADSDKNLSTLSLRDFMDIAKWFNSTPEMLSSATSFIRNGSSIEVALSMLGISDAQVQTWQKVRIQQQQNIKLGVERIRSTTEQNKKIGEGVIRSVRNFLHI